MESWISPGQCSLGGAEPKCKQVEMLQIKSRRSCRTKTDPIFPPPTLTSPPNFPLSSVLKKPLTKEEHRMAANEKRSRGRPSEVKLKDIVPKVLPFFSDIFTEGKKLSSPSAPIWVVVGDKMQKSAKAAYTYFSNDHQQIRGALWAAKYPEKAAGDYCDQGRVTKIEEADESCQDRRDNNSCHSDRADDHQPNHQPIQRKEDIEFQCDFSKTDILELTETRKFKNRDTFTFERRFKEGWTSEIAEFIWEETDCPCGFNFNHQSLTEELTVGIATGIFAFFTIFAFAQKRLKRF